MVITAAPAGPVPGGSVAYIVRYGGKVLAYIDAGGSVVDRASAALLEGCLLAYGFRVELGVDASVSGPVKLDGFRLAVPPGQEAKAARAVVVCAALRTGEPPEVVEVGAGKLYEVRAPPEAASSAAAAAGERGGGVEDAAEAEVEVDFEKA